MVRSKVINASFIRDGRSLRVNPDHPAFVDTKARMLERSKKETQAGVIWAEAKRRAGGEADLLEAIANGEIQKAEMHGIVYYFFPEVKLAKKDIISDHQVVQRSKGISDDTFATIGGMVNSMDWVIGGGALTSGSSSSGEAPGHGGHQPAKARALANAQAAVTELEVMRANLLEAASTLMKEIRTGESTVAKMRMIPKVMDGAITGQASVAPTILMGLSFPMTRDGYVG